MNRRKKKALITGVTGQDGSYLAELLLSKGYEVHGLVRRASSLNTGRTDHIKGLNRDAHLHYGDMTDGSSLQSVLAKVMPDEIYNLAAQSHVRVSFDIPEYTTDVVAVGTLRLLEAMRRVCPGSRFYQASSSEMFGNSGPVPQDERTPLHPESPYAIAKVFAHDTARRYRDAYGLHISCGILFNHESPRRAENFVTRKVTLAVARIHAGLDTTVALGNLDAKRDWGYAPEYCEAMWRMLQQKNPDDYVVATGETHTVGDLVRVAFAEVGIRDWNRHVTIDKRYYRPNEVNVLKGRATKAKKILGWNPRTKFAELVRLMVRADIALLEKNSSSHV